jgi:hypothetical protein
MPRDLQVVASPKGLSSSLQIAGTIIKGMVPQLPEKMHVTEHTVENLPEKKKKTTLHVTDDLPAELQAMTSP